MLQQFVLNLVNQRVTEIATAINQKNTELVSNMKTNEELFNSKLGDIYNRLEIIEDVLRNLSSSQGTPVTGPKGETGERGEKGDRGEDGVTTTVVQHVIDETPLESIRIRLETIETAVRDLATVKPVEQPSVVVVEEPVGVVVVTEEEQPVVSDTVAVTVVPIVAEEQSTVTVSAEPKETLSITIGNSTAPEKKKHVGAKKGSKK